MLQIKLNHIDSKMPTRGSKEAADTIYTLTKLKNSPGQLFL